MKRVYIVVEGQTEQEFVNSVISPYLQNSGILSVTPVLIRTSRTGRGGMVSYSHLANTIKPLLMSEKSDYIVTTFIDFFRLPHDMPHYGDSMKKPDKIEQIKSLEEAINKAIDDRRFFSYIQLHEFEALLFSSNKGFEYYFYSCMSLRLCCFPVTKVLSIIFRKSLQQKRLPSFHPTTTQRILILLLKGLLPKDCWL